MPRPARGEASVPSVHERELELKYAIANPDAVRTLLAGDSIAGLTAGPWRTVAVVDRYLDTASGSLERAGYGARLRQADHRTVLTVKSSGNDAPARHDGGGKASGDALHRRMELEGRANQRMDPAGWAESPARSLLEATVAGEKLRTLFLIDQRREERDLLREDGSLLAKLSLDASDVRRFGRRLGSFATLEVEIHDPENPEGEAELNSIAAALEESGLIRPERRSKEQIGAAMVKQLTARGYGERPPRQPGMTADDPLGEAGRKVLRMHLLRMLEAEPGVRDGMDVEPIHKMRVATRRMRAAWRVFDGAYRRGVQKRYVGQLREVAATLGAVRDLDVQLARLRAFATPAVPAASNDHDRLGPLIEEWRRRRAAARAVLLDLLLSRDYSNFVASYRSFVDTPGAGGARYNPGRVRDAAVGRIWRAYETFRAHETVLPWADVPALHAIRIDAKRLRYTLEFFREALPPTVDRLITEITEVQDHLGLLNDAQVASDITRDWLIASAVDQPADVRKAAGHYLEASEADVARLRRSFRPIWRRVSGSPFRRRLASTIAAI